MLIIYGKKHYGKLKNSVLKESNLQNYCKEKMQVNKRLLKNVSQLHVKNIIKNRVKRGSTTLNGSHNVRVFRSSCDKGFLPEVGIFAVLPRQRTQPFPHQETKNG